jgi:hypothetical protein
MTIAEFEAGGFDAIRLSWGPGKYVLMVYGPHPRTRKVCRLAREEISLEAPRSDAPLSAANPGGLETVLSRMMEQQAQFQQSVLQALSQRPDPIAGLKDTLGLMTMFREAMGVERSSKSSLLEIIGAIKELRGAAAEILPEREEEKSDLARLLETAAPILQVMQSRAQVPAPALPASAPFPALPPIQPNPAPPRAPLPAPLPENPSLALVPLAQAFSTLQPEQRDALMQTLNQALAELLAMHDRGESAEAGSDFLAIHLPEEILELLDLPNWFELLSQFAPQVAPHEAWIREAVALLDVDPGEPEGGAPGASPEAPAM